MLVLTRKIGESIRIGEAVIKVLEIRGSKVRIGIEAPPAINIMRTELEDTHETTVPLPPLRTYLEADVAA